MARTPVLTLADRAYRREKVAAAFRAGLPQGAIVARFGLTPEYVRQIARDAGVLPDPGRGRRRAWRDCPAALIPTYDAMRGASIPAGEVREILEREIASGSRGDLRGAYRP